MSNDTPKAKIDTATLLANLKKKADPEIPAVEAAPVIPAAPAAPAIEAVIPTVASVVSPAPVAVVDQYQQYTAARVSTCLITPQGKRINFTKYQYYTKDPEIIRYLDREIVAGLKGFTKGKVLTADELNPEAALKRKIIEEFKVSQEGREFGDTKDASERSSALNSGQVASSN